MNLMLPAMTTREGFLIQLQGLKKTASANKIAHYKAAKSHTFWHYALRIMSIVMSVAVGGSLFAALETNFGSNAKLWLAVISFGAATLTFLQLFLRSGEHATTHKTFASTFAAIERRIESVLVKPAKKLENLKNETDGIIAEITVAGKYAPFVTVGDYEIIASPTR